MERAGRQYQDGASPPRLRAQRVPALPAQRQVHGLQPHEAVDAAPERRTGDLEARVRFQTVRIADNGQPSHDLAVHRPDALAPVHAMALQHAPALHIGEVYADALVSAGTIRAPARSVAAHVLAPY